MKVFSIAISLALFSTLAFSELREACFKIDGMTCDSCAKGINSVLSKEKGVKKVETSFPKKTSVVKFESKETSIPQLKKHFETAGYKAAPQTCK
jgi:copper chaperone CopZ